MKKMKTKAKGIRPLFGSRYPLCRHARDGSVPMAKICILNDECWHCAFDQWLDTSAKGLKVEQVSEVWRDALAKAA